MVMYVYGGAAVDVSIGRCGGRSVSETHPLQSTLDGMAGVAIPCLELDFTAALEATAEPALEQLDHVVHVVEAFAHGLDRSSCALEDGK